MVTRSTDNGSYASSVPWSLGNCGSACATLGEGNSRKTALGASSPAKPALHIPDLPHHQLYPPGSWYRRAECEPAPGEARLFLEATVPCVLELKSYVPIVDNEGCNFFCRRDISISMLSTCDGNGFVQVLEKQLTLHGDGF